MKKISFSSILFTLILALATATLLTGCVDDDDNWPYAPPPGWGSNYFYDQDLNGTWELVQANSQPVGRYDTNYMEFYGGGRGRYYYYDYGRLYAETMAYFCQMSGNTTTNYQINVQYANGEQSTMAYWFTDGYDTLWLQWQIGNRTQTYIYERVSRVP
ncbi:MAG: hypothetical protein K2K64_08240 [Muribaculaceae bacterium]|nr:hypothetical protein [Muribaculaceae bacterium]MDE7108865.1 hypothetical protein [Muribaculaceae bacterium]